MVNSRARAKNRLRAPRVPVGPAPGPGAVLRDRKQAMSELPPVVYAARLRDGLVKIGWSSNLHPRLARFGPGTTLLGFRPGTRADELALHKQLADHVHHGREWYNPTPAVWAVVNDMRSDLGLEPVAA